MKDAPPPFGAREVPPRKVAWLHPLQLLRTAYHVWLSTVATEFIDRRETLAALDRIPLPQPADPVGALAPAASYDAELPEHLAKTGVWIDFIADIGDSWNATYAVLKLAVAPALKVNGHLTELPAASCVVLGGDLVYPTPTRNCYRMRTRSALIAAKPGSPANRPAPSLLAIPGNHDWYDGLNNFVREFCQGGTIGGWVMGQRRSYFAVRLVPGWWLWGIDIALDTRIDPPQQAYFLRILQGKHAAAGHEFRENDNIILCTAKPAWLDEGEDPSTEANRNLSYFVREIVEKHKGCVRVILSGDLHNYNRYENRAGDQLITAGGGGAYLSGTHHLPNQVPDLAAEEHDAVPAAEPNPDTAFRAAAFPYPSRADSRWLAFRAVLLALRLANWPFVVFVGSLYFLLVWTLERAKPDLLTLPLEDLAWFPVTVAVSPAATFAFGLAAGILLSAVILAAAGNRTSSRLLTVPWGLLHGFAHKALALVLAWLIRRGPWPDRIQALLPFDRGADDVAFAAVLIPIGGFIGATLVGVYLVVSDMLCGWHTNEVFAAQSIVNYRNFLRMHLDPEGTLTIFPIGLRQTPRKWRFSAERREHQPYYEPTDRVLLPHLIEGPLRITPRARPRPLS